jgi:hypothetical protein
VSLSFAEFEDIKRRTQRRAVMGERTTVVVDDSVQTPVFEDGDAKLRLSREDLASLMYWIEQVELTPFNDGWALGGGPPSL